MLLPRSLPTIASAMSMQALAPAEVQVFPSTTYRELASTVTDGYFSASIAQSAQWVATRLPSNNPSAASTKAPVQVEPNLVAELAQRAAQRRNDGSRLSADRYCMCAPTTSAVSTLVAGKRASARVCTAIPPSVITS